MSSSSLFDLERLIEKTGKTFSPEVVNFAKSQLNIDCSNWKDVAVKMGYMIADLDYLDLAGAMMIEHTKVYGPTSIQHYCEVMKDRLDPMVIRFIENHDEHLTQLMKKFEAQDYDFNFFSSMILKGLYLAKPSYDEDAFESPSYFYMRVVVGLFYDWKEGDPIACEALGHSVDHEKPNSLHWIERVYEEAVFRRVSFATPTLFSSGFKKSQKASCFLIQVGDNLEEILQAVNKMGQISKHRGGIGFDISKVRHSDIGGIGLSSGTRNLLLMYDKLLRYADQTGVRKGRGTVYQRPHHPDVLDFATIVDVDERGSQEATPNLDNAFWMNWMFFKRLKGEEGGKWTLFCPAKAPSLNEKYGMDFIEEYERLEKLYEEWKDKKNILKEYVRGSKGIYKQRLEEQLSSLEEGEVDEDERKELEKRINGVETEKEREYYKFLLGLVSFTKQIHVDDLMRKIIDMQRRLGRPYILNGDTCNFKSNQKNLGYISCSNLCTEIVEYTASDEVACCNLGSLVLGKFVNESREGKFFDFDLLARNTRMMVNVLNRVIDSNFYPIPEAENSNKRHRPIGLGVCGWGDVLNILRIAPDDKEAEELNEKIAACIYFNSLAASSYLGFKQGNYSTFEGSPMNEGKFQFDLWQEEYKILEKNGLLNKKVRRWEDQVAISPAQWGQQDIPFGPFAERQGKRVIQPTWESLRQFTSHHMRNSLLIARMPTASSASLAAATESAEIHSSNIYSRNVLSISAPIVNRYMVEDLKELGLWNRDVSDFIRCCDGSISKLNVFIEKFPEKVPLYQKNEENEKKLKEVMRVFRTIWEISQRVFIRHAAQAGIYICQSQSFNIFIPDPSNKQLKAVMLESADIGLKTLNYYVRSLPAVKPNANTVTPEISELGQQMRKELYFKSTKKTEKKKEEKKKEKVEEKGEKGEKEEVCRMEEGCVYCSS